MSKLNPNAKPFVPGASKLPPKPNAPKPAAPGNPAAKAKLQTAAKNVGKMAVAANAMKKGTGANAIATGDKSGGHLSERHIDISHGQMIDRIHGKDPGGNFKDKQRKELVSKFSTKADANAAMTAAMNHPNVKKAAANTAPGKISPLVKVPLAPGSNVKQQIMQGPGFVGTGKNKVAKQGPAQLINKPVKSVTVAVKKTNDGKTGFHTGYSNPD
jgi:hypothetical protein